MIIFIAGETMDQHENKKDTASSEHLRKNPTLKNLFDTKYGEGAADRVLNQ